MGNFRSNNRGGFNARRSNTGRYGNKSRSFGDSKGFNRGRDNRRSREMYNVICSKCGENCQVPFKPTNNKPVYCNNCFGKNEDSSFNFSSRNQNSSTQSLDSSDQFNAINKKLDKILAILNELELIPEDDEDEDLKIISDDEDSDDEDDFDNEDSDEDDDIEDIDDESEDEEKDNIDDSEDNLNKSSVRTYL